MTLTNNDDSAWDNSAITSFFLVSDPSSTHVSDTSSYVFADTGTAGPGSSTVFDFCLSTEPNNGANPCNSGQTANALAEGEFEEFQLVVSATAQPIFTGAGLRWQGVGTGDSTGLSAYGECLSDCDDGNTFLPSIPLPAGLPLVLTGLGVFGALRLRKRKTA